MDFLRIGTRAGWPVYIALSVFLNAAIASAIDLRRAQPAPREAPLIRLNLVSMAAPSQPVQAPPPTPAPVERAPAPAAPPPVIEKIVTRDDALKRLNTRDRPAPKRTAAPPQQPQQDGKSAAPPPREARKDSVNDAAQAVALLQGDEGRSVSTVIRDAGYRRQQPPVYPRRALELGQQGTVLLHAEIMPDGLPRGLKVAQSSGHELLDSAALAAVRKWEFEPVRVNRKKVAGWVRVPVRFVIQH